MFSGIIESRSEILTVRRGRDILEVAVKLPKGWKLSRGQSVSIDGICSTVVRFDTRDFSVEFMPETLHATTASSFAKGHSVNLERSLRYGALVDGNFVQGHVEGVGKVERAVSSGDARELTISIPKELVRYAATKGSIAINGVSLTIARRSQKSVTVALIPHTLSSTNLGILKESELVNIETDMLARYLAALQKAV